VNEIRRVNTTFLLRLNNAAPQEYGCVIIAPDLPARPADSSLPPDVTLARADKLAEPGKKIAFILDYKTKSSEGIGMATIIRAMENVEAGGSSSLFMQHAPVSHLQGEQQYDRAKSLGVRFYRFDTPPEVISQGPEKRFEIRFNDTVSGNENMVLAFEEVIVATEPDPDQIFPIWRTLVNDDHDAQGYLLHENPHCHSGRSFVGGVFAVGSVTGSSDLAICAAQASAAAIRARAWLIKLASGNIQDKVSIDESCCRCLTCARICPHSAISFQAGSARSTMMVAAMICRECGVCVSECPQNALDLLSAPTRRLFAHDFQDRNNSPRRLIYGCQRSAGRAFQELGPKEDTLFIPVPCAGLISEFMILDSLANHGGPILTLGCHTGNCRSSNGTDRARARVSNIIESLGLDGDKITPPVVFRTMASNEKSRLQDIIEEFKASTE
jgi:heterodisulfide reductase subunit A